MDVITPHHYHIDVDVAFRIGDMDCNDATFRKAQHFCLSRMGNRRAASATAAVSGLDWRTTERLRTSSRGFARDQVNTDGEALDFTYDELIELAKDFVAS